MGKDRLLYKEMGFIYRRSHNRDDKEVLRKQTWKDAVNAGQRSILNTKARAIVPTVIVWI